MAQWTLALEAGTAWNLVLNHRVKLAERAGFDGAGRAEDAHGRNTERGGEVHPEWTDKDCFAAGIPGRIRFIYQPKRGIYNWKGTIVKGLEPDLRYSAFYFDPATGRPVFDGQ